MARPYVSQTQDVTETDSIPYIPPGIYGDTITDTIQEDGGPAVVIYQLDYLPIPGMVSVTYRNNGVPYPCTILPWGSTIDAEDKVAIEFNMGLIAVWRPAGSVIYTIQMNGHYGTPIYGCHRAITEARSLTLHNTIQSRVPSPGGANRILRSTSGSNASFITPPYRTIAMLGPGLVESSTWSSVAYFLFKKQDNSSYTISIPVSSLENGDMIDVTCTAYATLTSGAAEIRFVGYLDSTSFMTSGHGGLTYTGLRRFDFPIRLMVSNGNLLILNTVGHSFGYYNTTGGIDVRHAFDVTEPISRSLSGFNNLILYPTFRVTTAPVTATIQATMLRVGVYKSGGVW